MTTMMMTTTMTTKMMTKPTPLSMNNVCLLCVSSSICSCATGSKRYSALRIRWYISVSNIFVRCCLIESQSSTVPPTFASHARCCHQYRQHYCAARVEDVVHRHQRHRATAACNCRCGQGRAAVREELDGRREVHRHRLDEVGCCARSD
jgi:hypothetical protein